MLQRTQKWFNNTQEVSMATQVPLFSIPLSQICRKWVKVTRSGQRGQGQTCSTLSTQFAPGQDKVIFKRCLLSLLWGPSGQQRVSWIPWNLSFCYILFLEKIPQTILWHHNARVNSQQRWKQMMFCICFHLWCELTSTINVTEWQVSWNLCFICSLLSLLFFFIYNYHYQIHETFYFV